MDLNRREFGTAATVSLSSILAGCSALESSDGAGAGDPNASDDGEDATDEHDENGSDERDDGSQESQDDETTTETTESDGSTDSENQSTTQDELADEESGSESDGELEGNEPGKDVEGNESEDGELEANESEGEGIDDNESDGELEGNESDDEPEIHEDESISGSVSLSAEAARHLDVVRHTFTWDDEPPNDRCQVHAMLANESDVAVTVDLTARIYDVEGNELSSTTAAAVDGPDPGVDDDVHSLELNNCERAAAYELELTDVEADDDAPEPVERHLFRVVVQDGAGEPIDHATVTVTEQGLGGWGDTQAVTDHGVAEFSFQGGEYTLTVTADGYPTLEEPVELTGSTEYTATLREAD